MITFRALSFGVIFYFMLSFNVIIFDVIIWCYYLFNVIIWCYHFSQFANVIIFVLSFFLVQHGCYHLCYHLTLSFFVIISPLFSFSWKRDTLVYYYTCKVWKTWTTRKSTDWTTFYKTHFQYSRNAQTDKFCKQQYFSHSWKSDSNLLLFRNLRSKLCYLKLNIYLVLQIIFLILFLCSVYSMLNPLPTPHPISQLIPVVIQQGRLCNGL